MGRKESTQLFKADLVNTANNVKYEFEDSYEEGLQNDREAHEKIVFLSLQK